MKCECPEANPKCCNDRGTAVYRVTRGNVRLSLCSHCGLPDDTDRVILSDIDVEQAFREDPLGGLVLALEINEKKPQL